MRKRIGAKILSVFMLILVICLAGIGIVTVQVKNMDKINQNIGNEYLNSIQEVNTLSVNEAYLESTPNFLKISNASPVAADDEIILIIDNGNTATGKPVRSASGFKITESTLKKPDSLRMHIATINPTSVGKILKTIFRPSVAPFKNASKMSVLAKRPYATMYMITKGIIRFDIKVNISI